MIGICKNRRERAECKAHGAQRPRHTNEVGDRASTVQRSNRFAQLIIGDANG